MDRTIVYPGSIPQDTDILNPQRNTMIALGYLMAMALGSGPLVDGLAASPTTPASLTVNVGPGSILMAAPLDPNAYGSLAADTTDSLVKMGINTATTSFTLTAPTTPGQSINYLIEATLLETDQTPVVLPYYNATNPGQPFSGPANSGSAQNTLRIERVSLQLKPGAPGNSGAQGAPAVDTGWVGLYIITVNYGQTAIGAANIMPYPTAPFVPAKLGPGMMPGFAHELVFTASSVFTVPSGVTRMMATVVGGGGSGGSVAGNGSGGGAGGGVATKIFSVTAGQTIAVTVGAGGAAVSSSNGQNGASSSFGSFVSATGGQGGDKLGITFTPSGGQGSGGDLNLPGGTGRAAIIQTTPGAYLGGMGGDCPGFGTGGNFVTNAAGSFANGFAGVGYGAGGGGAANGGVSGAGGAGLVIVRW